jgi:AbrB family looped-hinge helix DNA binding protein
MMALGHSKVTAQGQVSVPARIRQRLGVGPGSVLEWDEEGDRVIVRKAGRYSSEDIHRLLFSMTPKRQTAEAMENGIREDIKKRHARH